MEAEELLKRYKQGERDFSKVNLVGVNLPEANLSGINLSKANLSEGN
ncbi:MAG TPA: low-complexity protein, partial [Cyanobacteria bacterium UBA11049]|nr:low-complexity protein [Cyanobacteria bacterium UBA11049]